MYYYNMGLKEQAIIVKIKKSNENNLTNVKIT